MAGSHAARGARGRTSLARSLFGLGPIAALLGGCSAELDMSRVADPQQAHTTIPYTGVREETRQYPDYGAVRASMLTDAPSKPPAPRRSP